MTIADGAKYVAAAYAIIMAVLITYYFMSARRVATLQRDMQLLDEDQVLEVIASQLGVQVIDLAHSEIPAEVVRSVPGSAAAT